MSSVKRYEVNGSSSFYEDEKGSFVDYEDYAALEAKCAALAAENAGLKQFPEQIIGFIGKLGTSEIGSSTREAIESAAKRIKTPATDAYRAEVRAQGVEMFGQYHNFSEKLFIQKEAKKFAAQLRKGVQS